MFHYLNLPVALPKTLFVQSSPEICEGEHLIFQPHISHCHTGGSQLKRRSCRGKKALRERKGKELPRVCVSVFGQSFLLPEPKTLKLRAPSWLGYLACFLSSHGTLIQLTRAQAHGQKDRLSPGESVGATNPSLFVEVSPAVQVPVGILCACPRIRPAHQRSEVRAQLTQALQDSQTLYYKTLSIIRFTEAVLPSERLIVAEGGPLQKI